MGKKTLLTGRKTEWIKYLPCAEMGIEQPSICFSHSGHSLGNSTGDQKSTCLSVHLEQIVNQNTPQNHISRK